MKKILFCVGLAALQALFWCAFVLFFFTLLHLSGKGLFLFGFPVMFVGFTALNLTTLYLTSN